MAYRAEEYVAAESLDVALRHYAPAPMSRVLPFIAQLAGAIDFARSAGVGHGALHPRDIFVTPDEARATGFGVVEALERVGLRAPVRRPYSAPERVSGEPWSTPADVFSLAAIAYELLTGRRPSGTGAEIGSLSGTAVGRDSMDLVHAVLARAMDEQPDERFATALEFASALDAASQGRPPEVRSASRAVPAVAAAPVLDATPAIAERAKTPADPAKFDDAAVDVDDISVERESDEAHIVGLEDYTTETGRPDDRTLFEDENDEAIEDLALDAPDNADTDRFADEFTAAASVADPVAPVHPPAPDRGRDAAADRYLGVAAAAPAVRDVREVYDESPPEVVYRDEVSPPYRSGPSWPAAAALVVLALVVGFLAGQMIDPAGRSNPPTATTADETAPPSGPVAPSTSAQALPPAAAAEKPPAAAAPVETTPPRSAPRTEAAPTAPTTPRTGTLTVRSSPDGANVTIDGKWLGRTPLTLEDVAFGTREVRVVRQGYAVAAEDVRLSATAPSRSLSFRLQRLPASPPARSAAAPKPAVTKPAAPSRAQGFTGAIYVDSLPRGASVFVNGRAAGTTPVLIPDVPVGSQIVRLQLEEHRTWSTTTRVVAGQQVKVSGSLERIR